VADEPWLQQGSPETDWVIYLQQTLTDRGFDPGPVDGAFGPLTEAGVRAYQESAGITVDGIVGPQTWGSLHGGGGGEDPDGELETDYIDLESFAAEGSEAMDLGEDDLLAIQAEDLPGNVDGVDYSRVGDPDVA
jgi:hypothetical protein